MEHSLKKWQLNSKINSERMSGFGKPMLWINLLKEIFRDNFLPERDKVEVAIFVVSSFCGEKSLELRESYLLKLGKFAACSARACYRQDDYAYRAFEALANAAAIQLFKKMTTDRQMTCEVLASPMPEFTRSLRRRMGATWPPLPVDVP